MNKINFFKKIYYSIIGKKYKEMIEKKSRYAISYLAFLELIFTVIISTLVARKFMMSSFIEIYKYVENFLVDFFYNSVSLTFDTIMIFSIVGYLYQIIRKPKVKYYQMFCLATYSSTMSMIFKYIVFIVAYTVNVKINYFQYVYIIIALIYFIANYRIAIKENNS